MREEIAELLCLCYQAGANGEPCPVGSPNEELEALSRETGKRVERLQKNPALPHLFALARTAYDKGTNTVRQK